MASRGSHEAPVVDGKGELVDYAVRMHQFDPERQLDVELEAGRLGLEDMDELIIDVDTSRDIDLDPLVASIVETRQPS